jgi:hypothetical protein
VIHAEAAARNMLASAFALAGDLPSEVTTGCGLRAPCATTSRARRTLPACHAGEHTHRQHLRYADQSRTTGQHARNERQRLLARALSAAIRPALSIRCMS